MPEVQIGSVPFREAVEFFRRKLGIPTAHWDDLQKEVHAKAFTVAGATKLDLLDDLRQAVDSAIANGTTITEFRKRFDEVVAEHGWSYKGKRGWRTRVIYDTNLRTAHMAGKWQQFQRQKENRPYLQYQTAGDERVRPQHALWDDTILPLDDPWWETHYPPNGWGCRCTVRSLSQSQLERMGRAVSQSPEVRTTERVNTQSGEIYGEVPEGIDTGWDYNVGKEWLRWDKAGAWPDCGGIDFAGDGKVCIPEVPGQKTWKDYGRPDLREIHAQYQTQMPELLPRADSVETAIATLKEGLGMAGSIMTVRSVIQEPVVFTDSLLAHPVEKRQDARERYARLILPTLHEPYEVYLTKYMDGSIRSRYIKLFAGKYDMYVVVRRNPDGSIFWNIIPRSAKDMNKLRVGDLVYWEGE